MVWMVGSLLLLSAPLYAQTEFKQKVWIRGKGIPSDSPGEKGLEEIAPGKESETVELKIYQIKKHTVQDTTVFPKGSTLTVSQETKKKGVTYASEKETVLLQDFEVVKPKTMFKEVELHLPKKWYKANVHSSKDTVFFNFWLEPNYYADQSVRDKSDINPNEKYYAILKNRQSLVLPFTLWEMSAMTVPFKYHRQIEQEGVTVDPQMTSDWNANLYVGYRMGTLKYVYDKYEGMKQRSSSLALGGFVGLSSRTIDSAATSLHEEPLAKSMSVPVLSYGGAVVFDIRDVKLGVFAGMDNGIGESGDRWNFDNRLWFGIGLGYQLALLGKL